MSYILGLTGPVSFDQSAVLLKDGKIVAACEEERFSGMKHHRYGPPVNAIRYCMESEGITPKDLDSVAVGWKSRTGWIKSITGFIVRRPFGVFELPTYINHLGRYWDLDFLDGFTGRIHYFRHHMTHLASAFYCSGFDKSNIISIDECGETESTVLAVGDGEGIEVIKSFDYLNSLGRLYRQFTEYLGFEGNCDEYKVMGLAAYGKPSADTHHIIRLTSGGYSMETPHLYWNLVKSTLKKITKLLEVEGHRLDLSDYLRYGPPRKKGESMIQRHKDIAATIQAVYERVLVHLAEILHSQTGYKKFSIAGGCGLNCVANGKLLQQDFVDDLFVQPASSDAGSALGAALLHASKTHKVKTRLVDVGLGPSYPNDYIRTELEKSGVPFRFHEDIESIAAELLSKNKVIGWFQGRMEFGPRALGHRSILANPTLVGNRDRVNKLKGREMWRPLAPSLTEEALGDYFDIDHPNEFMTVVQKVKPGRRDEIPAVVHVDGTTRYQTVNKEYVRYYKLIDSFRKETGVPVILNTSFNARGEPIVRTPAEAIDAFRKLGLDTLILGNFIIDDNKTKS